MDKNILVMTQDKFKLLCSCGHREIASEEIKGCSSCQKKYDYLLIISEEKSDWNGMNYLYGLKEEYVYDMEENEAQFKLFVKEKSYHITNHENLNKLDITLKTEEHYWSLSKMSPEYKKVKDYVHYPFIINKTEYVRPLNFFDEKSYPHTKKFIDAVIEYKKIKNLKTSDIENDDMYYLFVNVALHPSLDTFITYDIEELELEKYEEFPHDTYITLSKGTTEQSEHACIVIFMKQKEFHLGIGKKGNVVLYNLPYEYISAEKREEIYKWIVEKSKYRLRLLNREKMF